MCNVWPVFVSPTQPSSSLSKHTLEFLRIHLTSGFVGICTLLPINRSFNPQTNCFTNRFKFISVSALCGHSNPFCFSSIMPHYQCETTAGHLFQIASQSHCGISQITFSWSSKVHHNHLRNTHTDIPLVL